MTLRRRTTPIVFATLLGLAVGGSALVAAATTDTSGTSSANPVAAYGSWPTAHPRSTSRSSGSANTRLTVDEVSADGATVHWTSVRGATGYYVARDGKDARDPNSGPWGTTDPASARSRHFDHLVAGATYRFSVTPKPGSARKTITVTLPGSSGASASPTTSSTATWTSSPTASPTSTRPSPTASPTATATSSTSPTTASGARGWLSGAAGDDWQAFGTWRGSTNELVSTWVNDPALYPLTGPFKNFPGAIDIAVNPPSWGGWAAEATGRDDDFFRQTFRNLKTLRAGKGTVYMRPWHEYNGDWMVTSVRTSADAANFKKAFDRVAAIGRAEFPAMRIELGTSASGPMAVANTLPSDSSYDVVSIDFYNNWPFCTTTACFNTKIENGGGVNSLLDIQRLATGRGKPILISEWGSNGQSQSSSSGGGGESPQFMQDWYAWLTANRGSGPGKVLGESYFDITGNGTFQLTNGNGQTDSLQPKTAEAYRKLW